MVHGGKCMHGQDGVFWGHQGKQRSGGSAGEHLPCTPEQPVQADRDGGETNSQHSDLPLGYLAPTEQEIDLGQSHEGRRGE